VLKKKFLIIGSGPTGLGAAYRLKELGEDNFLVLERSGHYGGLATSFVDEKGFTWDVGGHIQFSHYKYFDDLMVKALGKEWLNHQRESWAWMYGKWVPYPVQNNIRYLPKDVMTKCLDGIVAASNAAASGVKKPGNFKEWILKIFGQGFADVFMFPYNFKVWAYPPEELSYGWIGERVAVTDPVRVKKNIDQGLDDLSWGPNNTFQFPKVGGTGAVWARVAELIGKDKIKLNSEVVEVNVEKKTVTTASGDVFVYETLLSTMPLDTLCLKVTPSLDGRVLKAAGQLKHSTSHIVGLGLRGKPPEALRTKCWMYFPESNCPFYRVTVFSNYSPNNVPDINKYWSLMCETSESQVKPVDRSQVIEDSIAGAMATGLISSSDEVVSRWSYTAEYGYPTPSLGRDGALSMIFPELEKLGIFSRGRFGAWKYEVSNQDHSLMQGVEWVNHVLYGEPEVTFSSPEVVNSGKRT